MARIRTIKPDFYKSEQVAECHPLARILFQGLWTLADRRGRLEDRPKRIKIEVLPYDDCDVDKLLDELVANNLIVRYESGGVKVIWCITFEKHQRITGKEAETESFLPEYDQGNNGETLGKHLDASQLPRKGRKEGKGKEGLVALVVSLGFDDLIPLAEKYETHRKENGWAVWKTTTVKSNTKSWQKFSKCQIESAIQTSIDKSWRGIFPEKSETKGGDEYETV